MKRLPRLLPFAVVLAAGCYAGAEATLGGSTVSGGLDASQPPATPQLPPAKSGDANAVTLPTEASSPTCAESLPEQIRVLLEPCVGCHSGARPRGGLLFETYAQVVAAAPEALLRMKDAEDPMPPTGMWTDEVRAPYEAWIAAGTPAASCVVDAGTQPARSDAASPIDASSPDSGARDSAVLDASPSDASPPRDAGATDAGPSDAGPPDEFATPSVCTSGTNYRSGTGMRMRPGNACISCHSYVGAPDFSVAGTVYPTAHEPDNCYGVDGARAGATVVITDARGRVSSLPVNAYGNFAAPPGIALPYTAKVVVGTRERAMRGSQTNGDCNSCHTESGSAGAPGRILMPR